MGQSFKYTFKILRNTKGFLVLMVVMPIFMIILFSLTLAYSKLPMVGYVGSSEKLEHVLGIRLQAIKPFGIDYFLGSAQSTLVVETDAQGNVQRYYSSLKENPLILSIENQLTRPGAKAPKTRPQVRYSVGIILFKLLTAAELLATLMIQEKNHGVLVRVKQSKTAIRWYVLGKAAAIFGIYTAANIIILLFYQWAGFDFGVSNPLQLFIIFTIGVLISMGIYIFLAALLKNEGTLWLFATGILFPLGVCAGILFPMDVMPTWMKTIGRISPQYYLQQSALTGNIDFAALLFFVLFSTGLGLWGLFHLNKAH